MFANRKQSREIFFLLAGVVCILVFIAGLWMLPNFAQEMFYLLNHRPHSFGGMLAYEAHNSLWLADMWRVTLVTAGYFVLVCSIGTLGFWLFSKHARLRQVVRDSSNS